MTRINLAAASSDAGAWAPATSYAPSQVVTYAGSRYLAPLGAAASSFFDTSVWVLLGAVSDTF